MQNSGMENGQSLDKRFKVLIVDDHPNTADMLARAISRLSPDIEVYAATGGREAVEHAKNKSVDILITDMMMPEMTGLKLIETLGEKSLSPAASFLLTAYDSTELRESARSANVKQIIAKPVPPEKVCQLVLQTMEDLKQIESLHIEPVTKESISAELPAKDEPHSYLSNQIDERNMQ